jgi:hypothetical protein
MEFEAIELSHRAFANGCDILENMVPFDSFVFADSYFSGVNKGDTHALPKTNQFKKQGKQNHDFPLKFNKTIVKKQIRKLSMQMFSNIKQIKMFRIAKTAVMKTNHDK